MGTKIIFFILMVLTPLWAIVEPVLVLSQNSFEIDPYLESFANLFRKKIDTSKPGYYIILENLNTLKNINNPIKLDGGFIFSFIPEKDNRITVFNVPYIPYYGGHGTESWIDCNKKIFQKHYDLLEQYCVKNDTIEEEYREKIKSFVDSKKMSFLKTESSGNLIIIHLDSLFSIQRFNMIPPEKFDYLLDKSNFLSDYIELYKILQEKMFMGFENCLWCNFKNSQEIKESCTTHDGILFFEKITRQLEKCQN